MLLTERTYTLSDNNAKLFSGVQCKRANMVNNTFRYISSFQVQITMIKAFILDKDFYF